MAQHRRRGGAHNACPRPAALPAAALLLFVLAAVALLYVSPPPLSDHPALASSRRRSPHAVVLNSSGGGESTVETEHNEISRVPREADGLWGSKFASKFYGCSNSSSKFLGSSVITQPDRYLMIVTSGGLNQQRTGIIDAVVAARILNATLVVPKLDQTSFWKDASNFSEIFDVDWFISDLSKDVKIVKELPEIGGKLRTPHRMRVPRKCTQRCYLNRVLPALLKKHVVRLTKFDYRLANRLDTDLQKLRCRVNYHGLRFTGPIEEMGGKLIQRMRDRSKHFIALHLRFEPDMLAFSGCYYGGGDKERKELGAIRKRWKTLHATNPEKGRRQGRCPLTPEEVGLMLRALGYRNDVHIYVASGEIYGGARTLAPLKALFPNLHTKETISRKEELAPFSKYSSRMAALDFIVCDGSDAFVTNNNGNMAKILAGRRRYFGHKRTIRPNAKRLYSLILNRRNMSWDSFSSRVRLVQKGFMGEPKELRPGRGEFHENPSTCICEKIDGKTAIKSNAQIEQGLINDTERGIAIQIEQGLSNDTDRGIAISEPTVPDEEAGESEAEEDAPGEKEETVDPEADDDALVRLEDPEYQVVKPEALIPLPRSSRQQTASARTQGPSVVPSNHQEVSTPLLSSSLASTQLHCKKLLPCCMGHSSATSPAGVVDAPTGVKVKVSDRYVEIKNGIFELTLSNPDGIVTGVRYNGVDNLMEILIKEDNRGYWDLVWNPPGERTGKFDVIKGTEFRIIYQDENQAEVSFVRRWDPSLEGKAVPLNIDKRFIVLRGCSGFYTYGIYEHQDGWPGFGLGETRVAFKLRKDKFHYMALADNRQRIMPMPEDRVPPRGQQLAYPEAFLLVDPVNPDLRGEVDDKYQYSCEDQYNNVHGWISFDPPIGFWQITPSDEFRTGGPLKQNLTSHVGPTMLAMFLSAHYAGDDLSPKFMNGEYWKKVHGPVFMYLNSSWDGSDPTLLWEDAKVQMMIEKESWPYCFALSEDFQKTEQRGCISGRLLVRDRYLDDADLYATAAYVGLALPGDAGSWQRECKGYQFWCRADDDGSFYIRNIVAGDYNLYAWVPGFIGDYKLDATLTEMTSIWVTLCMNHQETVPRCGRSECLTDLPLNSTFLTLIPTIFRQYGLWERYAELYPDSDLVYTIGQSDYTTDWFYAQVNRRTDQNTYQPTTWQIKFNLDSVNPNSNYKFRVALASSANAELQVRFNDPDRSAPHFTSGLIGRDNAIARHGIHGLYWLFNIDVSGSWLFQGMNTIYLKQPRNQSPFQGLMYDYLRMEGPSGS
uniref:rhamnogalacturonan endolyase n=1 Tax=Leersia perrieri TaxID=77586 RepID=A0A0D9XAQ5_9ORYZ